MSDNVFAPPRANLETHEGPEALWDLTWKEIRKLYLASVNIRALGFLYGLGAFGTVAAAVMFLTAAAGADSGEAFGGTVGFMALMGVLGLLYVVACVTSFTRPRWARALGIVLCVLSLISFPMGTIIGIIGLIAYVQGGKLFGPDRLLHKDVALVYKQRKKDKQ